MDGWTDPNCRKAMLLIKQRKILTIMLDFSELDTLPLGFRIKQEQK